MRPETPELPEESPATPARTPSRGLIVGGFLLAVLSLVLGVLTAVPAIALGILVIRRGRSGVGAAIIVLAVALPVATFAVLRFVLETRAFRIPSEAMLPTLGVGDRVVTTKVSDPGRGDVVVFEAPRGALANECGVRRPPPSACPRPTDAGSETTFVKRVVADAGDRVAIVDGVAVVDGERLDEPYVRPSSDCATCNLPRPIEIPAGHYFVLGDNRGQSADSREWGPIEKDSIVGEIRLRYWPPARFGGL